MLTNVQGVDHLDCLVRNEGRQGDDLLYTVPTHGAAALCHGGFPFHLPPGVPPAAGRSGGRTDRFARSKVAHMASRCPPASDHIGAPRYAAGLRVACRSFTFEL